METIIAALISAAVTLAVCLITQGISNSKNRAVMEYQIGELSKRVEKHNQLIERTYALEVQTTNTETRVKSLQHQIDEIKTTNVKVGGTT